MARSAWPVAHGVRRMAQIRSGRGAQRIILFYETENIIPGAFRTGARRKWFYEIDPRTTVSGFETTYKIIIWGKKFLQNLTKNQIHVTVWSNETSGRTSIALNFSRQLNPNYFFNVSGIRWLTVVTVNELVMW